MEVLDPLTWNSLSTLGPELAGYKINFLGVAREGWGCLYGVGYEILALFLPSHWLPRPLTLILSVPWVQAPWALSIKAREEGGGKKQY